jgi:hypothetical protein
MWKANRKSTLFLYLDSLQKERQVQDDSSRDEASENSSEIPGKFRNVVLEKAGEGQLRRSCEK